MGIESREKILCVLWSVRNANWNLISLEKPFVTFRIKEQQRLLWLLSKPIKRLKLTSIVKGTVYPEMEILFTHPHVVPNPCDFLASREMFSSMFIQLLKYPCHPEWALEPIFTRSQTFKGMHSFLPLIVKPSFHCNKVVSRRSQQDNSKQV